ncbi:polysaccharide deacetylase family protein [Aliiroseovarius sp. S1339]|uniref:polysaccharide deacetylase family protein n=1 Tax=Aliiroseovarius sp. S1339 TaxID=2936990 RepID=UPI0020C05FD8|nr:polysaccharide deacetylase family protein [Aliiroseovarius sp. S1339]MCK8465174.1 polysaccharide deacetylase family protein [Aliiroseovarius sp. S1339]
MTLLYGGLYDRNRGAFIINMFTFFLFVAVIIAIVFAWFGIPTLIRSVQTRQLATACARKKAIVLSYDDGPSVELSLPLADVLKTRDVQATFFLLGSNVRDHPDIVDRLVRDGHELGTHTRHHSNAWKTGLMANIRDIKNGYKDLQQLGSGTKLFRPPFGKMTLASWMYGWFSGLKLAFWTVDSRDSWDRRSIPDILKQVEEQQGGVVLMHDFAAPRRGPKPEYHPEFLLKLTTALIDFAEKKGYQILRLEDLWESRQNERG